MSELLKVVLLVVLTTTASLHLAQATGNAHYGWVLYAVMAFVMLLCARSPK